MNRKRQGHSERETLREGRKCRGEEQRHGMRETKVKQTETLRVGKKGQETGVRQRQVPRNAKGRSRSHQEAEQRIGGPESKAGLPSVEESSFVVFMGCHCLEAE